MAHAHEFRVSTRWTGNRGTGTSGYREYSRDHVVSMEGKPDLAGSSAAIFRGDASRHNPEDLLVAALSACHLLSYLHLCAVNGVIVVEYVDEAWGEMMTEGNSGRFTKVILRPRVVISAASDAKLAGELHDQAHKACFIASSVNFPVGHEPQITKQ